MTRVRRKGVAIVHTDKGILVVAGRRKVFKKITFTVLIVGVLVIFLEQAPCAQESQASQEPDE